MAAAAGGGAGSPADDGENEDIVKGVKLFWNARLNDAEAIYAKRKDTHTRSALHYAEVGVFRAALTEAADDYAEAFARLNKAEQLATTASRGGQSYFGGVISLWGKQEEPEKVDEVDQFFGTACLCEVYFLLAMCYLRNGSYVKGAYTMRRCWKAFEAAATSFDALPPTSRVRQNKDLESMVSLGLGFFYFFISLTPAKFLWVVEAIGFTANRAEGLDQLERCHGCNAYRSPAAALLRVWIENFFNHDLAKSEALANDAIAEYETGALFLYLQGYLHRKIGKLDLAIDDFTRVYDAGGDLRQLQLAARYEQGWCHYLKLDWAKAAECFEDFLAENRAPSFQAYCAYQLGYCYEFMDRPHDAAEVLATVPGRVRKHYTYDQYAARKASEYNPETRLGEIERLVTRAAILCEGVRFKEVALSLGSVSVEGLSGDEAVQVHYYLGIALKEIGHRDQAYERLQRAIGLSDLVDNELYIIPHAFCALGEMLFEDGRNDEARTSLTTAKSYSEYDFDKPLLRRITRLLDELDASDRGEKVRLKGKASTSKPTETPNDELPPTTVAAAPASASTSAPAQPAVVSDDRQAVSPPTSPKNLRRSGKATSEKDLVRRVGSAQSVVSSIWSSDSASDDDGYLTAPESDEFSADDGSDGGGGGGGGGGGSSSGGEFGRRDSKTAGKNPAVARLRGNNRLADSSDWSDWSASPASAVRPSPISSASDHSGSSLAREGSSGTLGRQVSFEGDSDNEDYMTEYATSRGSVKSLASMGVSEGHLLEMPESGGVAVGGMRGLRAQAQAPLSSSVPSSGAGGGGSRHRRHSDDSSDEWSDIPDSVNESAGQAALDADAGGPALPAGVMRGGGSDCASDIEAELDLLDLLDEITMDMRASGVLIADRVWRLRNYKSCFVGSAAVDWFMRTYGLSRPDAVKLGVLLYDKRLIHHVTNAHPFKDGELFYRLQEDAKTAALNMKRICVVQPRSPIVVATDLTNRMFDMLELFTNPHTGEVDYSTLMCSKNFRRFAFATSELQATNILSLNESHRKAFFINMYNMMVIHGIVEVGTPTNSFQRSTFFDGVVYNIAGHNFSLNDIEHGVLRGNKTAPGAFWKQFGKKDPRLAFTVALDPRIHFALNCGARSCPALRMFPLEMIDGALDWAGQTFVDDDVFVDAGKAEVHLSRIFSWYRADFADTPAGLLRWIREFMSPGPARAALDAVLTSPSSISLKYKKYDWTMASSNNAAALEGSWASMFSATPPPLQRLPFQAGDGPTTDTGGGPSGVSGAGGVSGSGRARVGSGVAAAVGGSPELVPQHMSGGGASTAMTTDTSSPREAHFPQPAPRWQSASEIPDYGDYSTAR